MRTAFVLGSLGQGSNQELVQRAAARFGAGSDVLASLGELPFFEPTLGESPESVRQLRQAIVRADCIFIACPEYGHSLPGVLKNAIDWLIGSGELERKVVAITASVPSATRGLRGLAALRQTLDAVSARIVWDAPIVRGTEDEILDRIHEALAAEARTATAERIVAYLNPACSKSREAKEWLEARGLVFETREYLQLAPNHAELEDLLVALGTDEASVLLRSSEAAYAELGLAAASRQAQLDAITRRPELLQRPIVTYGPRAVIARPAAELSRLFDRSAIRARG